MPILIDYQTELAEEALFPTEAQIRQWFDTVLAHLRIDEALEVTVRLVENDEMTSLNRDYRGKDYATNVLSFPCDWDLPAAPRLLGDIVIAAQVVNDEAQAQRKTAEAHWAHIAIHGLLHLLGYDHASDAQAEEMEALEREILAVLGFPDPYALSEEQ